MQKTRYSFLSILVLLALFTGCSEDTLTGIFDSADKELVRILDDPRYEVQVIYLQIDRDRQNFPMFTEYTYNLRPDRYFYPASTVKLPVAILALEKIHRLGLVGFTRDSRMQIDSVRYPQSAVLLDSTSATGLPSVGHYIHKIFAVSDNDAYNRLYEFLGQDLICSRLNEVGIENTRIIHRLSDFRFGKEENRFTNPVSFFNADTLVYAQNEQAGDGCPLEQEPRGQQKGVAYINGNGVVIMEPFDFSEKNYYPLRDQVETLKKVVFPEVYPSEMRFDLSEDHRQFLLSEMAALPGESEYPQYSDEEYYDSYVKFFIYGDSKEKIPEEIRIFNKVGWAYGYLTDCAYIVDFENNIEFILAATIHVNANKTYNDGIYEEEEVGLPFLAALGRSVYEYEKVRHRRYDPDLISLKRETE